MLTVMRRLDSIVAYLRHARPRGQRPQVASEDGSGMENACIWL